MMRTQTNNTNATTEVQRLNQMIENNVSHLVSNVLKVGLMQWQEYFGFYQHSPDFDFSLRLLCELSLLVLHSAVRAFSIGELQFHPLAKSQKFSLI